MQTMLTKKFPNTKELLDYNFHGAIYLLKARNVVEALKLDARRTAHERGNNNYKTWSDYKITIEEKLAKTKGLDDCRMAKAIPFIAEDIHEQHFKRYPTWPDVRDKKQSTEVCIGCHNSHSARRGKEKFEVIWCCHGTIKVTDIRDSEDDYYTRFVGSPEIKVIYFNYTELETIEHLMSSNQAKALADKAYPQQKRKQLTFNEAFGGLF